MKLADYRRRALLSVGRAGGTQALAMSLVEVYAWTIDFFRLQKGDAFSVIYEEEYVDDTTYVTKAHCRRQSYPCR